MGFDETLLKVLRLRDTVAEEASGDEVDIDDAMAYDNASSKIPLSRAQVPGPGPASSSSGSAGTGAASSSTAASSSAQPMAGEEGSTESGNRAANDAAR